MTQPRSGDENLTELFGQAGAHLPLRDAPGGLRAQLELARRRRHRRVVGGTVVSTLLLGAVGVGGYAVLGDLLTTSAAPKEYEVSFADGDLHKEAMFFSPVTYTPVTKAEAKSLADAGNALHEACLVDRGQPTPTRPGDARATVFPNWNQSQLVDKDFSASLPQGAEQRIEQISVQLPAKIGTSHGGGDTVNSTAAFSSSVELDFDDDPKSCAAAVERQLLGSEKARLRQITLRTTHANTAVAEHQQRAQRASTAFYTCVHNERFPHNLRESVMKADVASWLARGFNFGSAYLASQAHGSGKTNTECSAPRGSLLTHQNPDQDISQQLAFAHDEDVQHRNPAVRTELAKHKATMLANAEKVLSAGK